jgi:hypothetical protein
MLLALASVVFLGSESLSTGDYILLSQIWDFPFRRLLRLAGSRWRYLTPPTHGCVPSWSLLYWHGPRRKHHSQEFLYCFAGVDVGTCFFRGRYLVTGILATVQTKAQYILSVFFTFNFAKFRCSFKVPCVYHSVLIPPFSLLSMTSHVCLVDTCLTSRLSWWSVM